MKKRSKKYEVRSMNWIFFLILITYFLLPTSINAQSVDILWQGETYAPPFYEGRRLWSSQSRITLVAIPQGLGNVSTLNYKWSRNSTVLGSLSGVGRNNISFVDSILSQPQTIKIEIVSGNGGVAAQSSIVITPRAPELPVYEENPLHGFMFHHEAGSGYTLEKSEVTFSAFPLFFSILSQIDSDLTYEWRTNVGGAGSGHSAIYRTPEDGKGVSLISVEVKSGGNILQSAKSSFLVKFGNENSN